MDPADPSPRLHPLLGGRFSPLAFDPHHVVAAADVGLLLEAARWSPSAGNSQPWGFVLAVRGTAVHDLVVGHLAASSRRWAPFASLLVVTLVHRWVDEGGVVYSEFAEYDVGQAVAHLTVQAHALDLAVRQFRAFDRDGLTSALELEPGWEVLTMAAVGRSLDPAPEGRTRRSVDDLLGVARAVTGD